jgi:diacylglycerol O-acyltransferase
MEHLTTLDAGFLEAEDSDPHVSLAIGGVSVIEGPMPDVDLIVANLSERVQTVPRLRQVLRSHILDLGPPEWVDDPHMDLTHHIHRAALPNPGDDAALYRFAADIMSRRLDRERPLWECWIIEGLADHRWALLMKIHHCIADGITTMHLLSGLSDSGDGDTFATDIRAANQQSKKGSRIPTLSRNPLNWASGIWRLAAGATSAAVTAVEGAAEVTGALLRPAATSSLNGPVTSMRRYAAATVRLRDVQEIRDSSEVTINDVALTAITDSYRAALIRRGERPRRNSLRTLVPVSVRSNDVVNLDNRVSLMLPCLPVDREDPAEQLEVVHRRLTRAKASGQREAGSMVLAATNLLPFPVMAWAVRALTRLPQRGVVTLATNVPGPRHRMHVMGREVVRMLPIPPIAIRLRTGVAIVSYADELIFGITADYDATPDVDELASGIEDAVARLLASARARSRGANHD